jgi:hypothetical protein
VPDYFDELLERIRDIRASERRVYLQVREIPDLASDYAPEEKETQAFFQRENPGASGVALHSSHERRGASFHRLSRS